MQRPTVRLALVAVLLAAVVPLFLSASSLLAQAAKCGDEGLAPCFSVWNVINKGNLPALDAFPCPQGQFFDLVEGGTCWTCPQDYVRTWDAVNVGTACVRQAREETRRATRHDASNIWRNCPGGQFFDIWKGYCYSCPSGFGRTLAGVEEGNACARTVGKELRPATKQGPGVIGCKGDLIDVRGTCRRSGECGKKGQRPCTVTERVPSCDAGTVLEPLKEDFKKNECVPTRPGETPFMGGLASLGQFYGDGVQEYCKAWIGAIQVPALGDLGAGATCTKDVFIGVGCALLRDTIASHTDKVATFADMNGKIGGFAGPLAVEIDKAYRSEACLKYEESLDSAVKHGRANGLSCPAGQFWDPNGNCYTCPKDYVRTLYPVDGPNACVNNLAGALLRTGCAVQAALAKTFDAPLRCTVQVLEDGRLFEQPLDPKKYNQTLCLATGELGYAILASGVDIGAAAATGDVSRILSIIGRLKQGVTQVTELKRFAECQRAK
jgi:hypothetical protein